VYKVINNEHWKFHSSWFIPQLERIQDLTPDVELFHRRYELFCSLENTRILYEFPQPNELYGDKVGHLNNPVFTELPLPPNALPEKLITLKILPTLDVRPAITQQFLDSLRAITSPLLFEIVASGGSIYLQLACAPRDQELIEQQLQLHFPKFAILPLSVTPTTPPLHTFEAGPFVHYQSLKTSSDFVIDPYQQLFTR
jgi:hypothetical protein